MGLTWSYHISDKISIGLTGNYTTANQNKGAGIDMQVLSADSSVAMYHYNRDFSYKQTGLVFKAGLAANLSSWQLGLTMTSPMLHLSGKGNYTYEEFFSS